MVRRGIVSNLLGKEIVSVRVSDARSLRRHLGSPEEFAQRLVGKTLNTASRRGKFIWLSGLDDSALVVHLGMSGQVRLDEGEPIRHERIRFGFADGAPDIIFADQRIFGGMFIDRLEPTADGKPGGIGADSASIPSSAAHIARDPLDPFFDFDAFGAKLGRRSVGIKVALLNQEIVSGIGNIYADEALWAAKLNYATPANELSLKQLRLLIDEVSGVMGSALDAGGTSFDDVYVNVNGESGYFEVSLNAYGRTGEPCTRCGTPIIRVPWQGRSSHFCPKCQPPRK